MRTLLALLLGLSACGPGHAPDWDVKDGSGQTWRLIECRHMGACLQRAEHLCPNGYVDRYEGKREHHMMIRCIAAR